MFIYNISSYLEYKLLIEYLQNSIKNLTTMNFYNNLQIGLCNAWIGPVIAWSNLLLLILINPGAVKRLNDMSWYTKRDKISSFGTMVIMITIMVVTIWIPLKTGTGWFYTGAFIFAIGETITIIATHNYGTTPKDKAIFKGMYKVSRHPLYLGWSVMLLGVCIASASLLLFTLVVLYQVPSHFLIIGEEKYCIKTYGKDYLYLCEKVPRYLGFRKRIKQ